MERSKQNKHVVCDKDNDVDDDVDNGIEDGVEDGDDDSVEDSVGDSDVGADKHLTHLSQATDCCLMERSKQNKHAVYDKDNDVDDGVEDGDNDSVEDGDNGDDGADKHLTYLSQAAD
eukprot:13691551-Ditylum_brightwellii.AAC.1